MKLKKSGSNVGLVFCREGLAGRHGYDGLGGIKNWYAMDRFAILVFDERSLESIAVGSNLVGILHDKYFDVKQLA